MTTLTGQVSGLLANFIRAEAIIPWYKLMALVTNAITCTRVAINAHLAKDIALSAHVGTWDFVYTA